MNADTRCVTLTLPEGAPDFSAGQYLELLLPHKNCPFSIASPPERAPELELHIRPTPDSGDSEEIEAWLDSKPAQVEIGYPKGDCFVQTPPTQPLLLIAASTGITQMNSILEHLLVTGFSAPVHLYWGVVAAADLYIGERYTKLARERDDFSYTPVVSEPSTSPEWTGATGLVGDIALAQWDSVANVDVVVSGGPGMVYACLDAFVARGMPEANMKSDIFSYAPRK